MKLNKLVIQNFLSVQDATLYLANKGLVSIEGDNKDKTGSDSNGSGKSSIINAILWCLYGTYGKDEAADDVVNSKAGKNCMVQSIWREPERAYRITRYRKHSKGKNSVTVEMIEMPMAQGESSEWRDITKAGAQAVQEQINQIMGADEQVFRASCFAQQENPLDIPAMGDKELKALLERVLPFEELTEQFNKARQLVLDQNVLVRKLRDEITMKMWQITKNTDDLAEAKRAFDGYTSDIEEKNKKIDLQIEAKKAAIAVAEVIAKDGPALKDKIELLRNQITELGDTDTAMLGYRIEDTGNKIAKLEKQLETIDICDSCGQSVDYPDTLFERLTTDIGALKEEQKRLESRLADATRNRIQKLSLSGELSKVIDQFQEAKYASEQIGRSEAEIRLLQGQKALIGSNPHAEAVERYAGFLEAAMKGKIQFQKQLKAAEERLAVLEGVQLTFSPKGLRYHMLEKVAPRLTADTNKYLKILTDGAIHAVWSTVTKIGSGEYREKFSIEARMEGRNKFGLLSGGEKRKVRLACFFALQDLIASRASKNIEIWCGDEIDEALDPTGLERLMVLLAEKTKNKSTILVISHNEMRDWIPNHATVTRVDGVSTITGYLNGS
jgi:DNA repair exonuclease SbcCD ATPase subunit